VPGYAKHPGQPAKECRVPSVVQDHMVGQALMEEPLEPVRNIAAINFNQ
jgi:hypothetical protein